jgi:hypothetical protein
MPHPKPALRIIAFGVCAIGAAAIVGTGGCKSNTAVPGPLPSNSPSPGASASPTGSPSPTPTANVFVSMVYASMSPTIDPTYGPVDGYALISPPPTRSSPSPSASPLPTQTPGPSSIVAVPCNVNVQFLNFDTTSFHTASLLVQPPGGGFPPAFNNGSGTTPSAVLYPISGFNFSSGAVFPLAGGAPGRSLVYTTGAVPGAYYIGDFFDYNPQPPKPPTPSMRTVILVQC